MSAFLSITENRNVINYYVFNLRVKSNSSFTEIFKTLEMALQLPIEVFIIPLSILLI